MTKSKHAKLSLHTFTKNETFPLVKLVTWWKFCKYKICQSIEIWKRLGQVMSKNLFCFFCQNGQHVWPKFKNIKQNWTIPEILTNIYLCKSFISWGKIEHKVMFYLILRYFLHFLSSKILSIKSLCNSWRNSSLKFFILDITFCFPK